MNNSGDTDKTPPCGTPCFTLLGVRIPEVYIGLSTSEVGTKKPLNVEVELELKDILTEDGFD